MKILPIVGAVVILLGLVAGFGYVCYLYGMSQNRAENNAAIAKVIENALSDQKALQSKLSDSEYANHLSLEKERQRAEALQRQLRDQRHAIQCVKDPGSGPDIAVISPDAVRVLVEAVDYPALARTRDQSCPFTETGTVTADLLLSYTACIIGKYNQVAGKCAGLIDDENIIRASRGLETAPAPDIP